MGKKEQLILIDRGFNITLLVIDALKLEISYENEIGLNNITPSDK